MHLFDYCDQLFDSKEKLRDHVETHFSSDKKTKKPG